MKSTILALLAVAVPLNASTLFSDLGTGSTVYNSSGGSVLNGSGAAPITHIQARPFTVSGSGQFDLTQIDLGVTNVAGPSTFVASIWAETGGLPGTELGSWVLTALEPAGSCCLLATQTGSPALRSLAASNTSYWPARKTSAIRATTSG